MNKKNFFKVLGLMMIFLLTGMVGFAQSDLPTFDLNGNVRSCEGTSIKGMEALSFLEFSSTGKLLKMNGASAADCNNGSFSIKRNVMGQISQISFVVGDGTTILALLYDTKGKVREVKTYYENEDTGAKVLDGKMVRTYNEKGLPSKEVFYTARGKVKTIYTYRYTKVDGNGNWIERYATAPAEGVKNEQETREIR